MPKKKTTLDDLARMVVEGFAHTAAKDELENFREDVNKRFDVVEIRLKA